jgi:beta-glucanase (GH16 family)
MRLKFNPITIKDLKRSVSINCKLLLNALILLLSFTSIGVPISHAYGGSANLSGYTLRFADEFNAPVGEAPNPRHWTHDVGGHGWGNNELQYYSKNPQNAYHDGKGHLIIALRDEPHLAKYRGGKRYSSARITTTDRFEIQHGVIQARLKVPSGQGIWPAFWMLGADFPETSWPACGEIDIMEHVGNDPTRMHTNIHGPNFSGNNGLGQGVALPSGEAFAGTFHTVTL